MKVTMEFTEGGIKHDASLRKLLDEVGEHLSRARRCVVVTGAGISVSGGIPDFRSADGLYNLVKQKYPHAVVKGKDLFDANLFKDQVSTSVFYTFIAELKDLVNRASITRAHEFIKSLEDRGKLLRCYTQNIDGLEPRLGMNAQLEHAEPPARGRAPKQTERQDVRVVQLHGDLDSVICTLCRAKFDFQEEHREVFQGGEPPACPTCLDTEATRLAAGKRKLGIGTLRPNIVLYNEHHDKGDIIAHLVTGDIKRKPDLMLVMGTSLKVVGIKRVVKDMAKVIHSNPKGRVVLINQTGVSKEWDAVFDYHVQGPADEVVEHLWRLLDGKEDEETKKTAKSTENKLPNTGSSPRISTFLKPTKASAARQTTKSPKAQSSSSVSVKKPSTPAVSTRPSRSADVAVNSKRFLSPSSATNVPSDPEPEPPKPAARTDPDSPQKRRRTLSGGELPVDSVAVIAQASVLEGSGFTAVASTATRSKSGTSQRRAQPTVPSATKVPKSKADQQVVTNIFKTTKGGTRAAAEKKVSAPPSGVVPRAVPAASKAITST